MTTVTTEQVQNDFATVKELMKRGETVLIEEDGVPLGTVYPARSRSLPTTGRRRILGGLEGQGKVPDDIKGPYEAEINEMFYGK